MIFVKESKYRARQDYVEEVNLLLSPSLVKIARRYAREYRTSLGGIVNVMMAYYFGDGRDHLRCDHCVFGSGGTCSVPEKGEQATIPLLDKGIVVVGHQGDDLGKCETTKSEQKFVVNGINQMFFEEVE